MLKHLIVILLFMLPVLVLAQTVDTVKTFDKAYLYQGGQTFKQKFDLPNGSTDYNKVLMRYTLSCPPDYGCDPWDVISVVDIVPKGDGDNWDTERWELARFITPYGGTFGSDGGPCQYNCTDKNWSHSWVIDVTDYLSLLKDSVELRTSGSSYHDWCCAGWMIDVDFYYYQGTLNYEPYKVVNLWQGFPSYYGAPDFNIEKTLTPQGVLIHPEADSAKLRVTVSGHGFGDGVYNSAEFYCNKHEIVINDGEDTLFQEYWRNDCEQNPVGTQAGTYYWNRAGWCPGDYVYPGEWDMTQYLDNPKGKFIIDYNAAKFVYTPNYQSSSHPSTGGSQIADCDITTTLYEYPGGGSRPAYKIEGQLIYYRKKCSLDQPILVLDSSGTILNVSNVTGDFAWYMDGQLLTHVSGNSFTPIKSATYMVAVTDNQDCTKASEDFDFIAVGINSVPELASLEVYPNPTDDVLHFTFMANTGNTVSYQLINVTGKQILKGKIEPLNNWYSGTIDVSTISAGLYVLQFQSQSVILREKVLIQ